MGRYLLICTLFILVGICAGRQDDDRDSLGKDGVSLDKMIEELSDKRENDVSEDDDAKKEQTAAKDEEEAEGKHKEDEALEESEKKTTSTSKHNKKAAEDEDGDEEGPKEEPKEKEASEAKHHKDDSEESDDVGDDSGNEQVEKANTDDEAADQKGSKHHSKDGATMENDEVEEKTSDTKDDEDLDEKELAEDKHEDEKEANSVDKNKALLENMSESIDKDEATLGKMIEELSGKKEDDASTEGAEDEDAKKEKAASSGEEEAEGKQKPRADSGVDTGIDYQLIKEITIPIVAFAVGAVLHQSESTAVYGKLAMFFGAQTVMNLYMKQVLSGSVVDEEKGLYGVPSAFIVTALQQLVAFIVFGIILLILLPTPYAYIPKKLETKMEWLAVVLFSFSFTMNIALNNFSISLLPLSVNLIIRSCLPLATFITQRTASKCTNEPVKDARAIELLFMVLGVCCAIVAVIAKSHVSGKGNDETKTLTFGIIICVASLFSGAINLALAGVLGTSCKLNSLDTTVYMSIPAFLFLIPPSLFYWHPVSWPGFGSVTDREIFMVVLDKKPSVILLAAFSGVLAFFYNVFQYGIVHSLSASYTAFAGNFNKAATIALGLILGLESLPPGFWGIVMICACLGNISAFTAFNIVKVRAKRDEVKPNEVKPKDGDGEEKNKLINKV